MEETQYDKPFRRALKERGKIMDTKRAAFKRKRSKPSKPPRRPTRKARNKAVAKVLRKLRSANDTPDMTYAEWNSLRRHLILSRHPPSVTRARIDFNTSADRANALRLPTRPGWSNPLGFAHNPSPHAYHPLLTL